MDTSPHSSSHSISRSLTEAALAEHAAYTAEQRTTFEANRDADRIREIKTLLEHLFDLELVSLPPHLMDDGLQNSWRADKRNNPGFLKCPRVEDMDKAELTIDGLRFRYCYSYGNTGVRIVETLLPGVEFFSDTIHDLADIGAWLAEGREKARQEAVTQEETRKALEHAAQKANSLSPAEKLGQSAALPSNGIGSGMTLREWYIGQTLPALAIAGGAEGRVELAFEIADLILARSAKETPLEVRNPAPGFSQDGC